MGLWMVSGSFNIGAWVHDGFFLDLLGTERLGKRFSPFREITRGNDPQTDGAKATDDCNRRRSHLCWVYVHSWRPPWRKVAYRVSALDEAELGYMGLSVSHGKSRP